MLKDAEKKQFTVVLVWKQDRFMRNRYESATDKMKLKKNGVDRKSVV
jgi:DNA invertase Pin-like site-specific DNA recombinase